MPQHTVRIVDSSGRPGRMKLRRVREHQAAGLGKFNAEGTFVFTRHQCHSDAPIETRQVQPARHVTVGRIVSRLVDQFSGSDSGFSLLAYPHTSQHNGSKYPALERQGAGL